MVALWPNPDAADRLALPDGESVENLHLTLAYCPDPDLDEVKLARLITYLDDLARCYRPIKLSVSGLGRFSASSSSDGKDVLYASIDAPELVQLHRQVCDILCGVGCPPSMVHGFTPHITLKYLAPGEETPVSLSIEPFTFKSEYLVLAYGDEQLPLELRGDDSAHEVGIKSYYEAVTVGWVPDEAALLERMFSTEQREKMATRGMAMPDGSFPIQTVEDLKNAIQAVGRAKNTAAARAHIIKRARALKKTDLLPEDWPGSTKELQESFSGPVAIEEAHGSRLVSQGNKSGSKWRVLLIKAGTSANRVHYSEEVLKRAAPLFEGVKAYADHPSADERRNRPERSVRDVVGWYSNVHWSDEHRGLVGDFNVLASAGWLREALKSAWDGGKPDLLGFSINAAGMKSGRVVDGGHLLEGITQVNSTDVVTTPGAGGRVLDILESTIERRVMQETFDAFKAELIRETRALIEAFRARPKKLPTMNASFRRREQSGSGLLGLWSK